MSDKINISISVPKERMENLMKKTEADDAAEVIANALRLYEALIDMDEKGEKVYTKKQDAGNISYLPLSIFEQ